MRSVHETDTMRPNDAITKVSSTTTGTPAAKLQRIRLKLTQPREPGTEGEHHVEAPVAPPVPSIPTGLDSEENLMPEFGAELDFDEYELALPPRDLYRLLRRQIVWAGRETAQLQAEWQGIEPKRDTAWREKEAIFDNLIEAEVGLLSAMVGSVPPANLTTSLEKLQRQQQQFQHQQELLSKAAEAPYIEGA